MKTNRLISRTQAEDLDLAARIRLERDVTDSEQHKALELVLPSDWKFDDYKKRSPWRSYLFRYLGDLADRTVLDLGCGYHPTPIYFALAGARKVYACDVSPRALAHIQKLSAQYHVADRVLAVVGAGERLPMRDESIDLVHGEAVLHHLDIRLAGMEIGRVLRNGGRAAFKDPFGHNPMLEFARDYIPYRWKAAAKGTDRPLRVHDIKRFCRGFGSYQYRAFGLLSMPVVALFGRDDSTVLRAAHRIDELILTAFPFVQRLCRFVVTCAEKTGATRESADERTPSEPEGVSSRMRNAAESGG